MQVLYRHQDHVKALGWLHSFSLCVCGRLLRFTVMAAGRRFVSCKHLGLIDWPNYNKSVLGYHSNRSIDEEPRLWCSHTVVYNHAMDLDLLPFGSKNTQLRSTCGIVRGRVFKLKP